MPKYVRYRRITVVESIPGTPVLQPAEQLLVIFGNVGVIHELAAPECRKGCRGRAARVAVPARQATRRDLQRRTTCISAYQPVPRSKAAQAGFKTCYYPAATTTRHLHIGTVAQNTGRCNQQLIPCPRHSSTANNVIKADTNKRYSARGAHRTFAEARA